MILHSATIAGIKHASRAIWIDVEGTDIVLRGKDRILAGNKPSEAKSEKDRESAIPLLCWNDEAAQTRRFIIASFDKSEDAELVAAQLLAFYSDCEAAPREKTVITLPGRIGSVEELADMRAALTDFDSVAGVSDARARLADYDARYSALSDDARELVTALVPLFGIAPTAEQLAIGIQSHADAMANKAPKGRRAKTPTAEQAKAMIAKLSAFVANEEAMKAMQSADPGAPDLQSQLAELLAKLNG